MKTLVVAVLAVASISASWFGWQRYIQQNGLVFGGVYVVRRGEVLAGDLNVVFAQITVEEGARVQGRIRALSSVLDIAGSVDAPVVALSSDVILRESASLMKPPEQVRGIPYVVLLPRMALSVDGPSTQAVPR